ncbi:hypothetical protein [Cytobacillus firmus]|uniref:hypothetical protein n=1 Tax=Cytobacillus firmus TaxID=1399 RepID=UPI0018CD9E62|nr:hypothetical protein [Cytobacillus firmus]MBG9587393.1 hypothetical protein [Cytobacillus firmus]
MEKELNERGKLILEDQKIVSFPPPDYSKMTNEQIRKRTEYMKSAFDLAFGKDEEDDQEDI